MEKNFIYLVIYNLSSMEMPIINAYETLESATTEYLIFVNDVKKADSSLKMKEVYNIEEFTGNVHKRAKFEFTDRNGEHQTILLQIVRQFVI